MNRLTLRVVLFAGVLLVGLAMLSQNELLAAGAGAAGGAAGAAAAGAAEGAEGVRPMPTNLFQLIIQNLDFVFVVIGVLSVVALHFIIQGFIKARAAVYMPETSVAQIRDMITNRQFQELIDFTETDPSFISKALNPALKRAPNYGNMKESLEIAIAEQTADGFRKIEILNIIGNMGPLLGLLGTVLGMIEAFLEMARAGGDAGPQILAAGISKALAHTFLGLFLAIPALMCYGILRQMTDKVSTRAAIVAEELLQMMKPDAPKPAQAPARPQPAVR